MRAAVTALATALLLLPVGACGQEAGGAGSGDAATDLRADALETLWRDGRGYDAFVADARRRRETWLANTAAATAPEGLLGRVDAAGGRWRVLAVAEDWCGDSAHTLPYVAALVAAAPGLDLRVVSSRTGRDVTAAHRTPDGRAATPTFVLLDGEGRDRGCLVERPPVLQEWFLAARDTLAEDDLMRRKYAWYDEDAGAATMEELVVMVEAAARGERRCVGAGEAAR